MKPSIQTEDQLILEQEVIRKCKDDPQAFRSLYEKYYKPVFVFVYHRIGDKDLSGDLTAQVFLKALQKIGQFKFRGLPFSSWLFRIAMNECNDFFRRTMRERLVVLDPSIAHTFYEEMFGMDAIEELQAKLPDILQRLKETELYIIELRFMEGQSFKQIAEILGITESYAKVRTYRTLEKMKKLFIGK